MVFDVDKFIFFVFLFKLRGKLTYSFNMYFLIVLYVVYCLWSSFSLKILQTIIIFGSVSIHYTFKLTSYLFLGSHQQSPRECVQRWLWWDFCSAHIFFCTHSLFYFLFCFILFYFLSCVAPSNSSWFSSMFSKTKNGTFFLF